LEGGAWILRLVLDSFANMDAGSIPLGRNLLCTHHTLTSVLRKI